MATTVDLIVNKKFVNIQGKCFHYVYLKDNCLCSKCYDPSSRQKKYNLSDFVLDPQPFSVTLQDDSLIIDWDEYSDHQSIFPLAWLEDHIYDPEPQLKYFSQEILWDRSWFDQHRIEWSNYCADTQKMSNTLINHLATLGFAVIRNIAIEDLETLILSIGPIYELAKFGKFSTVKPVSSSSNLASDLSMSSEGNALSPHTDMTYLNAPPVVQALYCVENNVDGGESIVVDGLRLTADLQKNHPDYFDILANTPVSFVQFIERWNYLFARKIPIIKVNNKNEVTALYFSHKNIKIDLPYEKIEIFYEAYDTFLKYLAKPEYRYSYYLEKGDCLFVNNCRILHGRNAFDSKSGSRHLEVSFIEWDYFQALQNFQSALIK